MTSIRSLHSLALLIALSAFTCHRLAAQSVPPNRDPDAARLVTSDIPNFWKVFDRASLKNAADLFQHEYIDPGSPGLKDFVAKRIKNARLLAANIAACPRYYAAIRNNTLAVDTAGVIKDSIRASFRRLKALYADAQFPDVYFVIGLMNSAGTTSSNGLLIGVEMNARDEQTPVDELGNWERSVTRQISTLPFIVAHELIHIQQRRDTLPNTLLKESLREGIADFIGGMISGGIINQAQHEYGDKHERALWEEFRKEMSGSDFSHWLFQGEKSTDRPADLGYYIGYRIANSFYEHASDKVQAIRRIINVTDADAFLKECEYEPGKH